MASVSLAEARAYLGIDGDDHDVYLAGMRREAERRVRRLTIIGDELTDDFRSYLYVFPESLQPAQLILIKWMFDRRENTTGSLSPPPLFGLIDGFERGVGNPHERPLRAYIPSSVEAPEPTEPAEPEGPAPFTYMGWTQRIEQDDITQEILDLFERSDGYGAIIPEYMTIFPAIALDDQPTSAQFCFGIPTGVTPPISYSIQFGERDDEIYAADTPTRTVTATGEVVDIYIVLSYAHIGSHEGLRFGLVFAPTG